ncbi:MAG: hypothetical protein JWO06_982 [Bacteroidota bacterium]|nr:hypothetical protein [Bacteroidota bacterium]
MRKKLLPFLLIAMLFVLPGCIAMEGLIESSIGFVIDAGEADEEAGMLEGDFKAKFAPEFENGKLKIVWGESEVTYRNGATRIVLKTEFGTEIELEPWGRDSVRSQTGAAMSLDRAEIYKAVANEGRVLSKPSATEGQLKCTFKRNSAVLVLSAKNGWYTVATGANKVGYVNAADNTITPLFENTRYRNGQKPPGNYSFCSACNGAGAVWRPTTCTACYGGGSKNCVCGIDATKQCFLCGGTRSRDCSSCFGMGSKNCSSCSGEGSKSCISCFGQGSKNCMACFGNGCAKCNGKGKLPCMACNSKGRIACHACHGRGASTCQNCHGLGKTECTACKINPNNTCNYCHGSGKLSCDKCQGKGSSQVQFLCLKCKGIGEVMQ